MRTFAKPMKIRALSLEARVLYSAFCAFLLAGFLSSIWLYRDDGLTLSSTSASSYYLGSSSAAPASTSTSTSASASASTSRTGDGPALALPSESDPALSNPPQSARQMAETFHFHAFIVPVCLLILGHLFMMCSLPSKLKVLVLVLASITTFAHVIAPLLVRFASSSFALVVPLSAASMSVLWAALLLVPLVEMWLPARD
ncbi:MAG TPA: hypothetical protein VGO62_11155 [Myxococcota bacterium]